MDSTNEIHIQLGFHIQFGYEFHQVGYVIHQVGFHIQLGEVHTVLQLV
jgi:hypothetical protein